jgi:hypothetical protein
MGPIVRGHIVRKSRIVPVWLQKNSSNSATASERSGKL